MLTSIGGSDQIRILQHLEPGVLAANPKPFFGLSDNTNLLNYLWNLGIVSYQGGTVMTMLGRGGTMNPHSRGVLPRSAVRRRVVRPPTGRALHRHEPGLGGPVGPRNRAAIFFKAPAGSGTAVPPPVEGRLWGGCLEIIDFDLRAARYLASWTTLHAEGCMMLYLETSKELPTAQYVGEVLMCMGERGLLQRFGALLMARPLAWRFEHAGRPGVPGGTGYVDGAARSRARGDGKVFSPDVPVILDVDFGHTDPHLVVPNGGDVRIDPAARTIAVRY